MIYQNTQNQFSNAIRQLQLGKLLRKSNITKSYGIPAYEVFQFLFLLVFQTYSEIPNIKIRLFPKTLITAFSMIHPITGESFCFF